MVAFGWVNHMWMSLAVLASEYAKEVLRDLQFKWIWYCNLFVPLKTLPTFSTPYEINKKELRSGVRSQPADSAETRWGPHLWNIWQAQMTLIRNLSG